MDFLLKGLEEADWLKSEADVFEEKTDLLGTQERIAEYDSFMHDPLHQWYEEAGHKLQMRDKGKYENPDQEVRDITLKPVQFEQLKEPEMGRKAAKKRNKALKKSKEEYEKKRNSAGEYSLSNSSTIYTDYILSVEAAYQKKGYNDWDEDPNPLPTQESELKRTMFDRKYNPEIFRKDFFGRNFEYVRSELTKLDLFLNYYAPGKPAYDKLSDGEKARITVMTETRRLMKICYEKALQRNSVEVTPLGLKLKDPSLPNAGEDDDMPGAYRLATYDRQWDDELDQAIADLAAHITGSAQAYFNETQQRIQQDYASKETAFRQEQDLLQKQLSAEYPLVQGKFFSEFSYSSINSFKAALDRYQYSANVEANRGLITQILGDYINMQEVLSEYQLKGKIWQEMNEDISMKYGADYNLYPAEVKLQARMITRETNLNANRQQTYMLALGDMEMALRHLIMGKKDLNSTTYMLLRKYDYAPAIEKSLSDKENGMYYADTYRKKEALLQAAVLRRFPDDPASRSRFAGSDDPNNYRRIVNMMRPGDDAYNDSLLEMQVMRYNLSTLTAEKKEVQVLTRDKQLALDELQTNTPKTIERLLSPKYHAIMDFNIGESKNLSTEALIAMQPELTELTMAGMMMGDIAKEESDIRGLSVEEKILGKPDPALEHTDKVRYDRLMALYKTNSEAFLCKKSILECLRVQARSAAILAASQGDDFTDPLSFMTDAEVTKQLESNPEYNKLSDAEKAQLSDADKVVLFARNEMSKAKRNQLANENRLARSEAISHTLLYYTSWGDTPDLMYGYTTDFHDGNLIVDDAKKKLKDYRQSLIDRGFDTASLPPERILKKQLYHEAEAKGDTQTMFELSVWAKLQDGNPFVSAGSGYYLAGEKNWLISEPMFRSFTSSDQIPSLSSMPEEEYHAMLSDLSAGAFLDEHSSEDEVSDALEKNKRGLRTYYDTIMPGYESFFAKYGPEVPDPAWVVLHFDEINIDAANQQIDNNLIEHDKVVLDESNAKDARLIHLVRYFNSLVGMCYVLLANFVGNNPSTEYTDLYKGDAYKGFYTEFKLHTEYLKTHPLGGE